MFRQIAAFTIGLVGIANLNAGQIQIGGANGLTSGTVTATTTATQSSGGKFGEQTWSNGGFTQGATGVTVPAAPPSSLTAHGITFAMINDSGGQAGDNLWSGTNDIAGTSGNPNPVTTTFTLPMGIFGVSNVYTMLNDEFANTTVNNGNGAGVDTTVTFNFGSAASGAGFLGSETFDLVNGTVIRDSFLCTGGSGLATCQSSNLGTTFDTTNAYGTGGSIVVPSAGVASVTAFNVFQGSYTSSAYGPYTNTSGTLYLDAQNFYLGSFAGDELFNMVIQDTQSGAFQSREELVAVTVVTPEPASIFLLVGGFGAIAFFSYRRRKSPASLIR